MTDEKLYLAVAKALGMRQAVVRCWDGYYMPRIHGCIKIENLMSLEEWIEVEKVADRVIDEYHIQTVWNCVEWMALCVSSSAFCSDRKKAALLAFCKFKGVAYE